MSFLHSFQRLKKRSISSPTQKSKKTKEDAKKKRRRQNEMKCLKGMKTFPMRRLSEVLRTIFVWIGWVSTVARRYVIAHCTSSGFIKFRQSEIFILPLINSKVPKNDSSIYICIEETKEIEQWKLQLKNDLWPCDVTNSKWINQMENGSRENARSRFSWVLSEMDFDFRLVEIGRKGKTRVALVFHTFRKVGPNFHRLVLMDNLIANHNVACACCAKKKCRLTNVIYTGSWLRDGGTRTNIWLSLFTLLTGWLVGWKEKQPFPYIPSKCCGFQSIESFLNLQFILISINA